MRIIEQYQSTERQIVETCQRCQRQRQEILLLAVTKMQPVEKILETLSLGLTHCGENYVQELQSKMTNPSLQPVQWHFIGRLQRNKIKAIVGRVHLIHSVDQWETLFEIEKKSQQMGLQQKVLLQVNTGLEKTKGGFSKKEIKELPHYINDLSAVHVSGLMSLPPLAEDPETSRPHFQVLRDLHDHLRAQLSPERQVLFSELSMGTSHDFTVAIEEGATILRLGTSLFGPRAT